jgi:hypothetical protein
MKTFRDYISEAEQLINEYNAYNASRNAFYDENVQITEVGTAKFFVAISKWSKMLDEEKKIVRKAIKAVKNCYRLFGIELPKKIDEYNMDDHLRKFKWMADDIDNKIRQYYRF